MNARNYRHKHNALLGNVGIIRRHLLIIQQAKSVTPEARDMVMELAKQLQVLDFELRRFRVEPDGTKKEVKTIWRKKDDKR